MSGHDVAIVSTAHWHGDPRLNRHISYLAAAGHRVALTTFSDTSRPAALVRAIREIWNRDHRIVILPDPELFVLGSLIARLRRTRPVIDIHEDYAKAAMARTWVPDWMRPIVRILAALNTRLGRGAAWRTMTAAPELNQRGDYLVLNLPDPDLIVARPYEGANKVVYVGDLTVARGAVQMVEAMSHVNAELDLVMIGPASDDVADAIHATATRLGVSANVQMRGRMTHNEAWDLAAGALAGLNLLSDVPAYREAVATKVWEYMAHGIPPIVSDLPGQRRIVSKIDEALVCKTVADTAEVIEALAGDHLRRQELGRAARSLLERAWSENRPDLVVQSVVEP